ncbi:MAG: hypothetical protein ABMA64_36855 [Myxococcota bacterium]
MRTLLLVSSLFGCPKTPPVVVAPSRMVETAADVTGAAGVQATVVGVLQRTHPPDQAADGTAIVLRDGTAVYVSEGEPPPGWDWMLGTDVRIQGVLWEKAPEGWAVPKLLDLESPMPADVVIPM